MSNNWFPLYPYLVCSTTLWVGQVDKKATQQDLTNLFEEFGQIESINVSRLYLKHASCFFDLLKWYKNVNLSLSYGDLKLPLTVGRITIITPPSLNSFEIPLCYFFALTPFLIHQVSCHSPPYGHVSLFNLPMSYIK